MKHILAMMLVYASFNCVYMHVQEIEQNSGVFHFHLQGEKAGSVHPSCSTVNSR